MNWLDYIIVAVYSIGFLFLGKREQIRIPSCVRSLNYRCSSVSGHAKETNSLDEANELKQLEVYRRLNDSHEVDLVATYLGAHIVPAEHKDNRNRYISLICDVMIPQIAERGLARFCDAFVEEGTISARDIELFKWVETADEAWDYIAGFYDLDR